MRVALRSASLGKGAREIRFRVLKLWNSLNRLSQDRRWLGNSWHRMHAADAAGITKYLNLVIEGGWRRMMSAYIRLRKVGKR